MKKYFSIFALLLVGIFTITAAVIMDGGDVHRKYMVIHRPGAKPDTLFVDSIDSISFGDTLIHIPQLVSVEFSADSLTIYEGQTANLTYKVLEDGVDQECAVTVTKPSVVGYSGDVVTGLAIGNAMIIVTASDNEHSFSDTCYVSVVEKPAPPKVEVTDVTLSMENLNLDIDETYTLSAYVLPSDATDKSITWTSTNKEVAIVDSLGVVTAIAEGTSSIIATSSNGITASCNVTVNGKHEPEKVAVTKVIFGEDAKEVEANSNSFYLQAYIYPENAVPTSIKWSCSNGHSALIQQVKDDSLYCYVTPLLTGTAEIIATVDDSLTAKFTLTVKSSTPSTVSVTGVTLSASSLNMTLGEGTNTLIATVSPENATDKSVTWSSSDEKIATVSDAGVVTAVAAGSAVITVKTNDKNYTATCNVTVKSPEPTPEPVSVTGIVVNNLKELSELDYGETAKIDYTVVPSDATNPSVTFKSTEPSIASVSSTGVITAKSVGTATITITSVSNTQIEQSIQVNVISIPAEIATVNTASYTYSSADISLVISGNPATVTEAGVEYSETNDFVTAAPEVSKITSISSSNTITISNLKEMTTYYYRAYILVNGDYEYGNVYSLTTKSSSKFPIAEAVDLGLKSGLKWSTWNMGATEVGEYGGYYCWGDIDGTIIYVQDYQNPSSADNIAGNATYDMATAQWGSDWRMPYSSEFEELFNSCTEELIEDFFEDGSNVQVKKLTGPSGKFIYLPRGGYYNENSKSSEGIQGYYWTCESFKPSTAERYYFTFSTKGNNWTSTQHGATRLQIRPVSGKYVAPKSQEDIDAEDVAGETSEASESVDLGLTVRWATCNVGATSKKASEKGNYYAWAETSTKDTYTVDSYTVKTSAGDYLYVGDDIKGDEQYDVARKNWGGKWRMPTDTEFAALLELKHELTTENGVSGYRFYGKDEYSNNSIFLPVTGCQSGKYSQFEDTKGYYWTSTLYSVEERSQYNESAWYISFDLENNFYDTYFSRYVGRCIRPVKPLKANN